MSNILKLSGASYSLYAVMSLLGLKIEGIASLYMYPEALLFIGAFSALTTLAIGLIMSTQGLVFAKNKIVGLFKSKKQHQTQGATA